ncbi:uncharacterized protein LOC126557032 [Anopheles maculipalpis]|uniref:uncharacterized protein LOC126557032 n=1 Tax=Anopheles maculipalpis TaxID=1496333 RepID=UPI00215933D5|nr:uncharacterized protein LOC126557032 [Anopheles maculipalpis]
MRKCMLLLLLPLTVLASRSPAAVFEDVFELGRPNAGFRATTESRNGMKAYLRKKYRQMRDPLPQASMMAAYTAAHERYQNMEEKQYDRVRVENLRKLSSVRTKRLDGQPAAEKKPKRLEIVPREMIKFELSDAMIFTPDVDSQSSDQTKARTKREEQGSPSVRVEPVPREILRFELTDAIVSRQKSETVNGSSTVARRHRRSASPDPRDYVKFELEDAKRSEPYTGNNAKVTENLRHPFTSSDSYRRGKVFDEVVERPQSGGRHSESSKKEKRESVQPLEENEGNDMNPEESRRIKIRGKKQKQIANYEDLPLGVQKAIDIALKENDRMNGKGRDSALEGSVVQSTPKYFFGDKKPKTKKPYSAATKISEPKFVPSAKLSDTQLPIVEEESNGQTGFIPSRPISTDAVVSSETSDATKSRGSSLQGIPKAWWSYSDLRRPKRLYHKVPVQPLVISPQYVNTFKPASEQQSKMNDLSPGYHPRSVFFSPVTSSNGVATAHSADHESYKTSLSDGPEEVVIKERPKIQYVIKEIPVPVQMKQPRTKITVQPSISISYDKDVTSPGTGGGASGQGYDNPYGPIELQYGHSQTAKEPAQSFQSMKIVIPDSKEESREQENYYDSKKYSRLIDTTQPTPTQSNEIDTSGGSIAALSALIGQRPSVQLQGLNQLLHMPVPMGGHEKQHRPQDSTAPVTFPESSTPTPKPSRPGYRSVQIDHGPKGVYDDSIYHTVQMNPQLQIPSSKEYTPIKEDVSDVLDSDFDGPTIGPPTHTAHAVRSHTPIPAQIVEHHEFNEEEAGHETNAYRHINIHSTPAPPEHSESIAHHYQEQHHHHHHPSSDHYDDSEGYAFGYRVRDFHTGNDFGHVQNHDNGVTRGEYHILLPDGRVQNVRYTADEKGFHADVTYESVHPASHSRK